MDYQLQVRSRDPLASGPSRHRSATGALASVEDEGHGFSFPRAEAKTTTIYDVALRVFAAADAEGVSPAVAADRLAEERMRSVGRLATIRLPR